MQLPSDGYAAEKQRREHYRVAVVGSGFAGLCMAIKAIQAGEDSLVVLERTLDIGGAWSANQYPGCACDIPSHLYSFSFAPNPDWSHAFSRWNEILAYLERCANGFGITPHVRFGAEVTRATYDQSEACWRLEVNDRAALSADVLVLAHGLLSQPHTPSLPGLGGFTGDSFHSAAWDHEVDLNGKRVAVVGTGASSIQFVPKIAQEARRLYVFQRTAPWILPKRDRPISDFERRLFRALPAAQNILRRAIYWNLESRVLGFAVEPKLAKAYQLAAQAHIRRQIPNPMLRREVTPDYAIGCKRVLLSNDYYPALMQENVELVREPIARVVERGIVTRQREYPADVIIFGTGFRPFDLGRLKIVGRDGQALADRWTRIPEAHRGTTVAGFPNLFLLVGPNTGLGHSSMVFMIESQVRYVLDALRLMRERELGSVEVRHDAQESWNNWLRGRLARTVWSAGCSSWYLDADGRNPTMWPTFSFRFREATKRFDPEHYHLSPKTRAMAGP